MIQNGQTILFQGDSITDCAWDRQNPLSLGNGYAFRVASALSTFYPNSGIKVLNRGVSGNRVPDLLNRYQDDILALKPDLVSILVGINDMWRRYDSNNPTTTEAYEENYARLLEDIRRDLPDCRIVIMEPFLLHTLPHQLQWREDLDPKIQAVRRLAAKYADVFIPLDGILAGYLASGLTLGDLSQDGVHPSDRGHGIIALEWLKAVGGLSLKG